MTLSEQYTFTAYLVAETKTGSPMFGPMDDVAIERYSANGTMQIFECGHCSKEGVAVYHNTLGRHLHCDIVKIIDEMPEEMKAANRRNYPEGHRG